MHSVTKTQKNQHMSFKNTDSSFIEVIMIAEINYQDFYIYKRDTETLKLLWKNNFSLLFFFLAAEIDQIVFSCVKFYFYSSERSHMEFLYYFGSIFH